MASRVTLCSSSACLHATDFVRFASRLNRHASRGDINGFAALNEQAIDVLRAKGFEPVSSELHTPASCDGPRAGTRRHLAPVRATEVKYNRLYIYATAQRHAGGSLRLIARGSTGDVVVSGGEGAVDQPSPIEIRSVWHGARGWQDTPIYDGAELRPGHRLAGPVLVEERTTTVLAGPSDELWVDGDGNFFIDLSPDADQSAGRQGTSDAATVTATPDGDSMALDPIVLALMQNRLDQISRHMGWVMTRTARSTIFSQSHDFSCFVTTPDGTLVANADGIPIHTGGGGFAVRALLGRFGGRMRPGDVYILSDPYVAGGNHLPDWVISRPIWVTGPDGKPVIAGFCCNRAHQSDIGGGLAGTYNPEATEIWHEGIRLPVMKLIDAGELRDDVWELLLINSRTPELLDGDLRAMLGSTQIGADRVVELTDELGVTPI